MDMVCHTAKGMDPATELFRYFLHKHEIAATISIINKYRLTCVAAKDDVIECTGEMYAWFACHGESIVNNV